MTDGESLDVSEEDGSVAQVEASAASAEPCVRVTVSSFVVFWASTAPSSKVCAIYASGLDETNGGQGLTRPVAEGFPSEPGLDDSEAFGSYSLLHLAKVGFGGGFVLVSAGVSEDGAAFEAFDEVFHVGYLEELSEHEGFEVPFGVVLYGSSGSFCVEVFPEDGVDRS